ncbi:MAG TPA: hypothetical protein VF654_04070 [Pyrinomonadaceae bacterium]
MSAKPFITLLVFLPLLAPGARGRQAPQAPSALSAKRPAVTFSEVGPKASGITWAHNNAHSPERWLPETVGAGGARPQGEDAPPPGGPR